MGQLIRLQNDVYVDADAITALRIEKQKGEEVLIATVNAGEGTVDCDGAYSLRDHLDRLVKLVNEGKSK